MKKSVKSFILVLVIIMCSVVSLAIFTACGEEEDTGNDESTQIDTNYYVMTEKRAIEIAKSSSVVLNAVANRFGLQYYYQPDWTSNCTANEARWGDHVNYTVWLRGTISGYKDEFKTNYVSKQKFQVYLTFYYDGSVSSVDKANVTAIY